MELIIVLAISIGITILNSSHVIIQWIANKPGSTFTAIAHSYADYFLYVGAIAQGAAGRWIWAEHLFTNESMGATWYYWFYVALGHIGSWVGLSPFGTYNVSLIILVFLLCLTWYFLTKTLYPTNRFLRWMSWLMIFTMTNFYWDGKLLGQFWFSPALLFSRLGGVPYHVTQSILFIVLAIVLTRILTIKSAFRIMKYEVRIMGKPFASSFIIHNSLFIIPLAFFAANANPVQMLLFGASAVLTAGIVAQGSWIRRGGVISLIFVAGGIGAISTNVEFSRQAVFTAARIWELAQQVPHSLPILLLSVGPVVFFITFGLQKIWKAKNPLPTLLIIWGLLSFILFLSPIPRLMGLSPVRFLHPVPYAAALAILGAEGLMALSGLLARRLKNIVTLTTIRVALIALYLLLTIPAIARQFTERITPAQNPQLLMDTIYNHVPAPITEALTWIRVTGLNPVSQSVVLVDPAIPIEVLVPVFTGLPSFSGHPIHTLYPDVKEVKRQEFFGGKMSPKDAEQFLKDHRIGYIITTPARRLPLNLRKAYDNTTVTIYKSTNGKSTNE